jgi:hypothetical protein
MRIPLNLKNRDDLFLSIHRFEDKDDATKISYAVQVLANHNLNTGNSLPSFDVDGIATFTDIKSVEGTDLYSLIGDIMNQIASL